MGFERLTMGFEWLTIGFEWLTMGFERLTIACLTRNSNYFLFKLSKTKHLLFINQNFLCGLPPLHSKAETLQLQLKSEL